MAKYQVQSNCILGPRDAILDLSVDEASDLEKMGILREITDETVTVTIETPEPVEASDSTQEESTIE